MSPFPCPSKEPNGYVPCVDERIYVSKITDVQGKSMQVSPFFK